MPSAPRRHHRLAAVSATIAAVAGAASVAAAAPAAAAPAKTHGSVHAREVTIAQEFVDSINKAREKHGVAPVGISWRLTTIARAHSARMGKTNDLYHNPSLTREVHNWTVIGENVGEGWSESVLHNAFMQSAPHRANILNSRYRQVGVGVFIDHAGNIWVTEDFRRPEVGTHAWQFATREIRAIEQAERSGG